MSMDICKICGGILTNNHSWLLHKLSIKQYFKLYEPKQDLLTGDPIVFKSINQYSSSDFLNKNNLKKYLKGLSKEGAAEYCKSLLKRRKDQKNLIYTPSQIELISLPCFPPIHYLNTLFDYYHVCEELGFVNKFKHPSSFVLMSKEMSKELVIDSRESKPLKFDVPIRISKLDVGDYWYSDHPNLVFERKSINDLYFTLSGGLKRFKNELLRSIELKLNVIVLVEQLISAIISFKHIPFYKARIKASSDFIFHNMRELIQEFPNLQFLFVNGRIESSELILKVFKSDINPNNMFDLQLLYDLKKI